MEFSRPSVYRMCRFIAVFYVTMTLLYFAFFSFWGIFEGVFRGFVALLWPASLSINELDMALVALGLTVALTERRVTEVIRR